MYDPVAEFNICPACNGEILTTVSAFLHHYAIKRHALQEDYGPRTCQNICDITGGEYCKTCEYWGKITSPIQLGKRYKQEERKAEISLQAADIIGRIKGGDKGAHLEVGSIEILEELKRLDGAEFARIKDQIGKAGASIAEFNKAIKRQSVEAKERLRNESQQNAQLNMLEDSPFPEAVVPEGYELRETGVYKVTFTEEDVQEEHICHMSFIITSKSKDITTSEELIEISFKDREWQSITVSRDVIANSRKIVDLALNGFPVNSVNAGAVILYLAEFEAVNRDNFKITYCTSNLGWQGDNGKFGFLVGDELITTNEDNKMDIKFRALTPGDAQVAKAFSKEGSLDGWLKAISSLIHFPVVMAAFYAGFAVVMIEILGFSNFTYELACRTSKGKTTSQRVVASIWGVPDERKDSSLIHSWNNTKVYMERIAAVYNGLPLILDDTKQAQSSEAISEIFYMISNGRGRGRGNIKSIGFTKTIKTVLISTAETPSIHLSNHGGTRGRVLEVTSMPFGEASEFTRIIVTGLNRDVKENYGHAGPAFVRYVLRNRDKWKEWKTRFKEAEQYYTGKAANSELAGRLAEYAAAICVVGGIVHEAMPIPWEYKDPIESIWPIITSEAIDPTGEENCLTYVISWAMSHRRDFATRNEKRDQPAGGWLGRWDEGSGWSQVAFIPNVLHKLIKEAGYEIESTLRSFRNRGWLNVNEKDTRHKYVKQVKLDGENTWMVAIKREALGENESTNEHRDRLF